MKITEYMKDRLVILDGGMGTLLQASGMPAGQLPERWNVNHGEVITAIHRDYFDAGSNVVSTNTFGANILKFDRDELEQIISSAVLNARKAQETSSGSQEKWVALDIGPTGRMLKPLGDLDFEDAVEAFAQTVRLGVKYGVDLIFIETMNDLYETKAALLAAKENSDLPVFVSNAYGEDAKLMTGASPAATVALLEGMGADAIGVNCSLGPKALSGVVGQYLEYSSLPVILKPNAGLPKVVNGSTVFDVSADEFAADVALAVKKGVRIAGGCCGTNPAYIKALCNALSGVSPVKTEPKDITIVSSYTHAVVFSDRPVLIGERINPTGKRRFKEALRANDTDYILKEGIAQQEAGADILDVNVGLPEIDEPKMLCDVLCKLQAVTDLPLQIDTSDISAMEKALRRYNGKPMINSVNGKEESMRAVFPLVKKYGGLTVALTLDEKGIPATAEGRLEIAERILKCAGEYGIDKKDLIFDPLAMAVSADKNAANETLRSVRLISEKLGAKTSLGVSNVSFGLPKRDVLNGSFFTLALANGLSAAIMNPYSVEMMKAYRAWCALTGSDLNCSDYIAFAENLSEDSTAVSVTAKKSTEVCSTLGDAIVKGLDAQAAQFAAELLKERTPLDIIQNEVIPALDTVGRAYEEKRIYLPGLLMSAEAAKSAFEQIKASASTGNSASKCPFVIATVKGDIHDIGKNIVRLMLENYGFAVCDLGKDVAPSDIADKVVELHAPLAGLSALMTTTVPAMEETVRLIKQKAPWCKTVVGGAVLNEEYAAAIGADKYAKDAMETVRYAENIFESTQNKEN